MCVALTAFSMASCVDTIILPDDKTVDEDFWQTKEDVATMVNGAYAAMTSDAVLTRLIVWGDFRTDEVLRASSIESSNSTVQALDEIASVNMQTTNTYGDWAAFYSVINRCNIVLERAEEVMQIDPNYTMGDYQVDRSQMLALRALCYFYLVRNYRDVPYITQAYMNSSQDMNVGQSAPLDVISRSISDLEEAAKNALAARSYGVSEWRRVGWITDDAINALLADIYLWRASVNRDTSDYEACVEYCDQIIKAKKEAYELKPSRRRWGGDDEKKDYYLSEYNEMFSDIFGQTGQNADESIFELQFRSSNANNTGLDQMYFRYNNASSNGYGYLKAASVYGKVDATGNGVWTNSVDQRLYEFLYDAASTSTEQFGVRKFVATTSAGINNTADSKRDTRANVYQNWILYRLTDVMLMKAEALVQLYNLGGKAEGDNRNEQAFAICQYINNRSLSDANKSSYAMKYSVYKDKMEELVLAERARELCFEGKRWFDLMRYNYRHTATKANLKQKLSDENYTIVTNSEAFYELALRKYAVPTTMKAKIRDERYLYMPINQDEVEINTNLVQNPVYKSASKY